MKQYIGTKIINAKPMTRGDYNVLRGWTLPADENADDAGYLVEYLDGGKANHPDFANYISWSPADVFERAYTPTTGFGVGELVKAVQLGHKVDRAGWNGKGMFLFYVGDGPMNHPAVPAQTHAQPYIAMFTATGTVVPWLASQSDLLATDYRIVP